MYRNKLDNKEYRVPKITSQWYKSHHSVIFVISVIYNFKVHFWGEVKHFFIMLVLMKQVCYTWSPPVSEHFRWCTEHFSKYFHFPLTPCVKQKVFQKCSVHHRKFSESRVEHEYTTYVILTCIIKKLFHFAPINHKSHKSHKSHKHTKQTHKTHINTQNKHTKHT